MTSVRLSVSVYPSITLVDCYFLVQKVEIGIYDRIRRYIDYPLAKANPDHVIL